MKIYTDEELKKKYWRLQNKAYRAVRARNAVEKIIVGLRKNKNLWAQFCKVNGVSEYANTGDLLA